MLLILLTDDSIILLCNGIMNFGELMWLKCNNFENVIHRQINFCRMFINPQLSRLDSSSCQTQVTRAAFVCVAMNTFVCVTMNLSALQWTHLSALQWTQCRECCSTVGLMKISPHCSRRSANMTSAHKHSFNSFRSSLAVFLYRSSFYAVRQLSSLCCFPVFNHVVLAWSPLCFPAECCKFVVLLYAVLFGLISCIFPPPYTVYICLYEYSWYLNSNPRRLGLVILFWLSAVDSDDSSIRLRRKTSLVLLA